MKYPSLALSVLFAPFHCHASATIDREIDTLYDLAEVVVKARVIGITGECEDGLSCATYRVLAKLEDSIKISPTYSAENDVSFCTFMPLEMNESYTVFVFREDEHQFIEAGCALIAPVDGVFQHRAQSTYRVGSPESVVVLNLESKFYRSSAVLEPDFEELIEKMRESKIDSEGLQ